MPPASGNPPQHLLVALHGWGANAEDLAPLGSILALPDHLMIFPNAPFNHPQAPGGKAWYSLETQNYQGLVESRQILLDWLTSLPTVTGVPLEKTILIGFSQGGAMTLDVGINLPLAGICSLSGYLHHEPQLKGNKVPPVFIVHGKQDLVVPLKAAQRAKYELVALGIQMEYHELDMGHEITSEVLDLIRKFILARELG